MPSASVTAKPKISRPNWPSTADGLRSAPFRNWPNSVPTPMPAAPVPIAARPAPTYLAAMASSCGSMRCSYFAGEDSRFGLMRSVTGVKRVVEIHAGQHGEHIGLQERDQKFERVEADRHDKRQNRERLYGCARAEQHDDEAAEHVERDVAREHVGEQTHRMADGTRQEGDDLDRHDQRQYVNRHAGRDKKFEEVEPVLPDADDDNREEHHERQGGGDDDLARHRE